MATRHSMPNLYYFTIEDESMLAEAFAGLDRDVFAIAYKVDGSEDVFVTTAETKQAMDRNDVPYHLLAEEDARRVAVYHSVLSREELIDYEDVLKALTLAYRGIAVACVGVNGDSDLGFDLSDGEARFTYFTPPSGHTFILRVFVDRKDAVEFISRRNEGEDEAVEWAKTIPLESSEELATYH